MNDVISTERGFGPYLWLIGLFSMMFGAVSFVILSGGGDVFRSSVLVAEVKVEAMALPAAFQLNADEIASDLSERLQRRAVEDFALRTLLGADGQQQLADIAVPRLLNAAVIRRMIQDIPSLGTVTAVGGYHSYVSLIVTNHGDATLSDVALSAPDAARAETTDGTALRIVSPQRNVDVVNLGNLEPGAQIEARVWFERGRDELLQQREAFLIAAGEVRRGQVNFRGTGRDWFGADLEVTPWARWLVGAVVLALSVVGLVGVLLSAYSFFDARRRQVARH